MEIDNQKKINKEQVFLSLKFSFLFFPLLYIFGLFTYLTFPLLNYSAIINFPNYLITKIGFVISLICLLILFLSIYLCLKKINFQFYSKIFYLPLYSLLIALPLSVLLGFCMMLSVVIFILPLLIKTVFYFFLISIVCSLVIYLWLKNLKVVSIFLLLFILILSLVGTDFYIKKYLNLGGCHKDNGKCIDEKIILDASIALRENKPEICYDSPEPDACFYRLAITSKQSSVCEHCISSYNRCYEYFAGGLRISEFDFESKEKLTKIEPDLCSKLQCTHMVKNRCETIDSCYANAYQNKAIMENDTSYCDKADEYGKFYSGIVFSHSNCYMKVAVKTNDVSICDRLSDYEKDSCYFFLALEGKKDCSFIKATSGEYSKKQCEIQLNQYPYKK